MDLHGKLLGPLMKIGLLFMKNSLTSFASSLFTPLGLTAAASVADAGLKSLSVWNFCFRKNYTNNIKRRNERYHGNS